MAGHPARNPTDLLAGAVVLVVFACFLFYAVTHSGRGMVAGQRLYAEFDNIGSLAEGADVRIAGVRVGQVLRTDYDEKTARARVRFTVPDRVRLPDDSSAQIASAGLLSSASLNLVPGGGDRLLHNGDTVPITQSAANLEDLLGKFIFNVGNLAEVAQKQLDHEQSDHEPDHSAPRLAPGLDARPGNGRGSASTP